MKNEETQPGFSNREFIRMIRSALDETGHADIKISRQWIVEDQCGFAIHVPVGTSLSVKLTPRSSFYHTKTERKIANTGRIWPDERLAA
ncbi:MAG: hypothetical protein KGJ57_19295 [Sphingomonadales bacterium]|nr:hypothetical protein [Sphingomonadales bacterium]MDE2171541.1 hypothetical protein [Sphingomonadales bacterium]